MTLHPQIIEKDGRKEFVVLPYEEFLHLQEELQDYHDLLKLRQEKASASTAPCKTLDQVVVELTDH
jgi:PHD/YefM family antitoxin component YafN of YafNO toxin-antitoxin module